jgi:GNAT superfamily N-acetyltransferase
MEGDRMPEIEIDFFRSEDAPGVARLFRRVYGEGYPIRAYYEPDQLIAENAVGRIISTVARTEDGEIAGHDALVLVDPQTRLYENAAGAVLPDFRGQGVFFRVMKHSIYGAAAHFGLEEILGEPVCNHLHLQKMCTQLDYRETGLEVDLMPAAAYTAEASARGRVSVLLGYFLHKPVPRTVYLPPVYREALEFLYGGLSLERTFTQAKGDLPFEGESRGKMDVFAFAQVARIAIHRIGPDLGGFIAQMEEKARQSDTEVFQAWLPLTSPFAPAAADVLRRRGYFIGGLLPNTFDGDGLLMQKVTHETDWEGISFYSERAKRIGEIVRNDQKNTEKRA